MKLLLPFSAFALLLAGASCSGEDQLMERPRRYSTGATESTKRHNDKSSFKKNRSPIGLGLDMNARDPHKFRMVNAPKRYKYSKPK